MGAHRILRDLFLDSNPLVLPDPGDAGELKVDRQFATFELVSAAAETRTLPDPKSTGQRMTIAFKTDGGDITITADTQVDDAGTTSIVLKDAGEVIDLIGVDNSGSMEWRVLASPGVSGLAATQEPGSVVMYAGSSAPTGWQLCDGSSLATADEPNLFNVIGYAFGGSGANFNVPDMRGRSPTGVGTGVGLDAIALADSDGVQDTTLVEGNLPSHTHQLRATTEDALSDDPEGGNLAKADASNVYLNAAQDANMRADAIGNTGSGTAFTNRSPYVGLNFIIKK